MDQLHNSCGKEPEFGICFDVDGVLARGTEPLDAAKDMVQLLKDENGEVRFPVTYVTNSLNRNCDKAQQISNWLDIEVLPEQMIHAQGPLEVFKKYHSMHCLIIGQGKIVEIARDLGFTNTCTIEQVSEAYPLLDMVDHDNRKRVAKYGYVEKELARIDAIILLGEPARWETPLQLLVDILKTDGKPNKVPEAVPDQHLPVLACNMDLEFMDRACMPRYGHGAFLICLETLYKKVTGRDLKYTALIGKPSEITFRYAEHCLIREAQRMGCKKMPKRMYLVGDTPEVDIVGSNLYNRYIKRTRKGLAITDVNDNKINGSNVTDLSEGRQLPGNTDCGKHSVEECTGILVCTGVYKEGQDPAKGADASNFKGHRDFPCNAALHRPYCTVKDVYEAVEVILKKEMFL